MGIQQPTMSTSKYRNKKTEIDGILFDSKKEANRYLVLKSLKEKGAIHNLQIHVPYELIGKDELGQAIKYVADFVYYQNGLLVVEDVKSPITRKNPVYRLKKRMMYKEYKIIIKET